MKTTCVVITQHNNYSRGDSNRYHSNESMKYVPSNVIRYDQFEFKYLLENSSRTSVPRSIGKILQGIHARKYVSHKYLVKLVRGNSG